MKNSLLAMLVALSFGQICSAQIIQNGGFEDATLAPWASSGDISATRGSNGAFAGNGFANLSFTGAFGAQSFTLSQSFNLGAAAPVTLVFYALRFDGGGFNDTPLTFTARIDNIVLSMTLPPFSGTGANANNWLRYEVTTPSALSAGAHTLAFDFSRGATSFGRSPGLGLDAVSIAVVPEASTNVLLFLGGGVVLLVGRRFRTARS